MTNSMVWHDTEGGSTKDTFTVPAGSGERSILCHLASDKTELVEGFMVLYRGKKALKDSNYHKELCWDVFSLWCKKAVFPTLTAKKRKTVLVLDRATFHTYIDDEDKLPRQYWLKPMTIKSVVRWVGPPDDWVLNWRRRKTKA